MHRKMKGSEKNYYFQEGFGNVEGSFPGVTQLPRSLEEFKMMSEEISNT